MIKPNRFQRGLIRTIGIDKFLQEREQKEGMASLEMYNYRKQDEYKVWNEGSTEELEFFYKTLIDNKIYHSFPFWRMVNTNMPRAHYPLPSTITNAMRTLLFSNEPSIKFTSGSKERNKSIESRWEDIAKVNNFLSLLQEGAEMQSYSGGVAYKLNLDSTLTDVPLFTIYDKSSYEEHKRLGQTIYIDFMDAYGDYTLVSRYGRGYINYKLYKDKTEVPLNSHPDTADLKDLAFISEEDNLLPIVFATVVPNAGEGKSDFEGLISSFHTLDEAYSSLTNYIRKTKPNTMITEDLAPKDMRGNTIPFNEFDNVIVTLDSAPAGTETQVSRDVPKVDITGYKDTFYTTREVILSKTGISPSTVGIDSSGANASGDALNIRERASANTRSRKLAVWRERLNEFLYAVMMFDEIGRKAEEVSDGVFKLEEISDFDIKVDFGPYHEKSYKEKVAIFKDAQEKGLASVRYVATELYGDKLSDEDLDRLIVEIKVEHNYPLTVKEKEIFDELYGPSITKP